MKLVLIHKLRAVQSEIWNWSWYTGKRRPEKQAGSRLACGKSNKQENLPMEVRCGVFPAMPINKAVTVISDSSPPGQEKNTCNPEATGLQPLPMVSTEGKCQLSRVLAPDSWDAYERSDFSKPRHLHLSKHRKVLNSLTWDSWFSLIHKKHFWRSDYLLFVENFYMNWPLPPTPSLLRAVLSGSLEMLFPSLKS